MRGVMMASAAAVALGMTIGAGAAQAAGSSTDSTSPVVIHPLPARGKGPPPDATVNVPMDDNAIGEFASVWPRAAYEARIKGEVTLSCLIDRHGLAEHCDVASETPQGKGFGEAACSCAPPSN